MNDAQSTSTLPQETAEEKAKRLEAELEKLRTAPMPEPATEDSVSAKRKKELFKKLAGDKEDDEDSKTAQKSKALYGGLTPSQRKHKANKELNRGLEDLKEDLEKKYGVIYIPWPNVVHRKKGLFTTGFDALTKEEFEALPDV